jgi:3-oxoacyl-[acyl-carrier-protein] synthase II
MKRRVAIVGIGVLSPNGIGKENFWKSLKEGKSGIKKISCFDASSYSTRIAGEIQDFDPTDYISPREVRRTSRATQLAIAAAKMAICDSGIKTEKEDEVGVIMGVSASAMDIVEEQHMLLIERGLSRVSPFAVTAVLPGSPANNISVMWGFNGSVMTISNSCPAGLDAIGYAFREILCNRSDLIVAGGADAQITPFGLAMLCASRVMSERNDNPEGASRPFDKTRDGGVLSEGSGVMIVEEMERALNRGAHVYGEILGYASKGDGAANYQDIMSDSGISRTMKLALKDADIKPEEVDYICAHAPSDEFDKIETIAIKQVFGEHAYKIPISSIKSMTGNPLAAAGPLQLIASIMVLQEKVIPPTINFEYPDDQCDLDYVPVVARKYDRVKVILINSHGFGGINSSLVIRCLS